MEYFAIFAAAVAASSSKMQICFNLLAGGMILVAGCLVLYVAMVVAVVQKLEAWGRDMDKRAARWEREHQEYMISLEKDARRWRKDRERFTKRLSARRR